MKKKIKLFVTISTLCLSLAMFIFGVYSAMNITYKTNGTINYTLEDVFVDIETRVYSSSKKYTSGLELKTQSQGFESSNFDTLNQTTMLDDTYTFNKVQIQNTNKDENYTPVESDYVDTYSYKTFVEPEPLELLLNYNVSEEIFSFFVVTKITNKSELPLFAYVPVSGTENSYKAPSNSYTYKISEYKELKTRDSEVYIVFSISIKDIGASIKDSQFVFPIVVTKDIDTIKDEASFLQSNPHISELELIGVTEEKETVNISTEGTTVQTQIQSYQTSYDYALLNLDVASVPEGQDIQFTLFPFVDAAGQIMPGASVVQQVMFAKTTYSTFDDIITNYAEVVEINDATYTLNTDTYTYEVSIPRTYLDSDGTMPLVCGFICESGIREQLQSVAQTNLLDVTVTTTAQMSSSKITKNTEWNETNYLLQTSITDNVFVIKDTYYEDNSSITKLFTYKNYRLGNIPADTEAIDLIIKNNMADSVLILPSCKESVTVISLLMAAQNGEVLNLRGFQNGTTTINIPLSLDENGYMEFCVVHLYKSKDVVEGQKVSLTTNTQLTTIASPEQSDLFVYEMFFDRDYNPCYSINGLKDTSLKTVTIPNYFNGLPVRYLGYNTFNGNTTIEVVDFEENSQIEDIDGSLFTNCTNLTTVNFHKCKKLKSLTNSFTGCKKLTNMKLPDSIEIISGVPETNSLWFANNVVNGIYTTETGVRYAIKLPKGATSFDFDRVTVIADSFAEDETTLKTITNLNSVKSIGSNAFENTGITQVSLPSTLKYLSNSSFKNCALTNISVGSSNLYFKDYGQNCIVDVRTKTLIKGTAKTNLMAISDKVTRLGDYSLTNLTFDENFEIPSTITNFAIGCLEYSSIPKLTIQAGVGYASTSLQGCIVELLTIKSDVETIDKSVFSSVEAQNFVVETGNPSYKVVNNCLTNIDETILIKGNANSIIPSTVTEIAIAAFRGVKDLISIQLPEGITTLDDFVFNNCSNLKSVTIPQSVTTVGYTLFSNCTSLTEIIWNAKNITTMDYSVFVNYDSSPYEYVTLTLGESVESIPANLISGWPKLAMLNIISTKLTTIPDGAFKGCYGLKKVNYVGPDQTGLTIGANNTYLTNATWVYNYGEVEEIVSEAGLYYKNNIVVGVADSNITDIVIKEGTTQIEDFAFYETTNIKTITIPESITTIGIYAFGTFSDFATVNWNAKNVTECGGATAFEKCKDNARLILNIGENVESLPVKIFTENKNIKVLNIYSTKLTEIADSTFKTGDLRVINYVGSDKNNITIATNNSNLNKTWNTNYDNYASKVNDNGLYYVTNGTQITLVGVANTSLTNIVIKDGTTHIAEFAFKDLKDIKTIAIPESVTNINPYAFYNCSGVTTLNWNAKNLTNLTRDTFLNLGRDSSGVTVNFGEDITTVPGYMFDVYDNYKDDYANVKQVNFLGRNATKINTYAFSDCRALENIKLPSTITTISSYVFENCASLTRVVLPQNLTGLSVGLFKYCRSLANVIIPSGVTSIGMYAFSGCDSIKTIDIPNGVNGIGAEAFYNCDSLVSVTIPDSVTSLGSWAFAGCNSLTNVKLSSNLKTISSSLFLTCPVLKEIIIPSGVKTIETQAFINCESLTTITLPSSLTSIGNNAFNNCSSLTIVNYAGASQSDITIGSSNTPLTNAVQWNYNYVG